MAERYSTSERIVTDRSKGGEEGSSGTLLLLGALGLAGIYLWFSQKKASADQGTNIKKTSNTDQGTDVKQLPKGGETPKGGYTPMVQPPIGSEPRTFSNPQSRGKNVPRGGSGKPLPAIGASEAAYPSISYRMPLLASEYIVHVNKDGDYPAKLALDITGNAGRYKELYAANPMKELTADGSNFKSFLIGEEIALPDSWWAFIDEQGNGRAGAMLPQRPSFVAAGGSSI